MESFVPKIVLGTKYRAWDKISCLGQNIVLGGTKYRAWGQNIVLGDKISCLGGQNIVLGGTKYRAWRDKISCLKKYSGFYYRCISYSLSESVMLIPCSVI